VGPEPCPFHLLRPPASPLNFRPVSWDDAAMITLILTGLLRTARTQRVLVLENLALRHQLAVLQRTVPRPLLRASDRVFWVLLARVWRGWPAALAIVLPDTVIRWQRAGGADRAAQPWPPRSACSATECARPTHCGGRRGFTANFANSASRSVRPRSPSTYPAVGPRPHRPGARSSPTMYYQAAACIETCAPFTLPFPLCDHYRVTALPARPPLSAHPRGRPGKSHPLGSLAPCLEVR
jgi:hypothetical protein